MTSTPPLVLLLVEDDAGHATLFERTLRRGGMTNTLIRFSDGEQVLTFLREGGRRLEKRYVLVLDLNLPRIGGLDVLRDLREDPDPGLANLPAMVLSTTGNPEEAEEARTLGCYEFLSKPVDFEGFLTALDGLGIGR